jgi:hypothetical protein
VAFSPDEGYAVDFTEGGCKLRKLPGNEIMPLRKKEILGYCSATGATAPIVAESIQSEAVDSATPPDGFAQNDGVRDGSAWLENAHQELDKAVVAACDWPGMTPETPDDKILRRLLALNLTRG